MKTTFQLICLLLPILGFTQGFESDKFHFEKFMPAPDDLKDKYSYAQAVNVCESSHIFGHDDWRLPNIDELQLMFNDLKLLPLENDWYWSSSENDVATTWCMKNNGRVYSKNKAEKMHVRCIRNASSESIIVASEDLPGSYKWEMAKEKCENLNSDGHLTWRLPDYHELLYIYKKGLLTDLNGGINSTWYWSGSDYSDMAWSLRIDSSSKENSGTLYKKPFNEKFRIRCIRNEN